MEIAKDLKPNSKGQITQTIERPISKVYVDMDWVGNVNDFNALVTSMNNGTLVSDRNVYIPTPYEISRFPEVMPFVTIKSQKKDGTEQHHSEEIPIMVLFEHAQFEEGAMSCQLMNNVTGLDTETLKFPIGGAVRRMRGVIDLTPKDADGSFPSLTFDRDEKLIVEFEGCPPNLVVNLDGLVEDDRTNMMLKYSSRSVGVKDKVDIKSIHGVKDVILPTLATSSDYISPYVETTDFGEYCNDIASYIGIDVEDLKLNMYNGQALHDVDITFDSGRTAEYHHTALHHHSFDSNDSVIHFETKGFPVSPGVGFSVVGYFTHHILPVQTATEIKLTTDKTGMEWYHVDVVVVSNPLDLQNLKQSDNTTAEAVSLEQEKAIEKDL